jgi:dihydrofolate synthase/folylpolyglutamate synthase
MAVLGDTLAKIAGEKAGIIKDGVPVISAPQKAEALEVLVRVATERHAPLTLVGRDVTVEPLGHTLDGQSMQITGGARSVEVNIPLLGMHQMQNAATAAGALWEMERQGIPLTDAALLRGFAEVRWPARFEIARREPPVIFDSAHNQDSFAWLRQSLDEYFPGRPVYLIFGASEDKNIPGMFAEIRDKLRCMFITRADHPRALAPESILPLAAAAGIPTELHEPVAAAFERALGLSEKDGSIVLSAGSMFVTAEAIAAWQASHDINARQEP